MKIRYPAVAFALLVVGCSQDEATQFEPNSGENPGQSAEASRPALPLPVWFFGTVHRVPENGGVWLIRTAGGTQYQPSALPEEFQVDGLAVEIEARKHDTVMAKDTLGQEIDIVEIRKR